LDRRNWARRMRRTELMLMPIASAIMAPVQCVVSPYHDP